MTAEAKQPELTDIFIVGENDHGYQFGVGQLAGRWVGFAIGYRKDGKPVGLFFLPGISEDAHLGLLDRERAIRMTGAIACDPEHGYGGVARWFIEKARRGNPDEFRCERCGSVGCDGDCDDGFDYELFDMV